MTRLLRVRLLTVDGQTLEEDAVSVRAPGGRGAVGVLYNHAPLLTTIRPGVFRWRRPDGAVQAVRVGQGLMEVAKNRVTLLTDTFSEPQALSEARR